MTEKKRAKTAQAFSREQILESKLFQDRRDLLGAILEDGKIYTIAQVESQIEQFLKGTVK